MERPSYANYAGAGAPVEWNEDDAHVTYLPLIDHEGHLLPIHFLTLEEVRILLGTSHVNPIMLVRLPHLFLVELTLRNCHQRMRTENINGVTYRFKKSA